MASILDTLDVTDLTGAPDGSLKEILKRSRMPDFFGRFSQANFNYFYPGKVTCNHYHHSKEEIFGVGIGTIDVYLFNNQDQKIYCRPVSRGQRFTLRPGIPHALHNSTQSEVLLVEFTNLEFDKTNSGKDIYPFPLLDNDTGKSLNYPIVRV